MTDEPLESTELAKIRGQRVKWLRELVGLSRKELETRYHISLHTQKNWELGRMSGLTTRGAEKLISIFKKEGAYCSAQWLLEGIGSAPQLMHSPFSATQSEQTTDLKEDTRDEEVSFFLAQGENRTVFSLEDESMSPVYQSGDTVGGVKFTGDAIQECIKQHCIIETVDGDRVCRLLAESEEKGLYNLLFLNAQITPLPKQYYATEILTAAPIIWMRRGVFQVKKRE